MGIEEGLFNLLVSKTLGNALPGRIKAGDFVWEFPPSTWLHEYHTILTVLLRSGERGVPVLLAPVDLCLPLHFASFSYHFI